MKTNFFDEQELALNKKGFLSYPQIVRLRRKIIFNFSALAFMFSVWPVISMVFIFQGRFLSLFCGIGAGIVLVLLFWAFLLLYRLKKGTGIKVAEGEADFSISYSGDENDWSGESWKSSHHVKIGKLKFRVEESVFDALKKKRYRFYYFSTPRKELLTVEPIE